MKSNAQNSPNSRPAIPNLTRREFIIRSGAAAAGSALAGVTIPYVHAAESDTIRLALIGCGGRGSGAAANAFESPNGPVKMGAHPNYLEYYLIRVIKD